MEKNDYGGYEFRILSSNLYENFSCGIENGDVVNDTLFRRDTDISERLNIILTNSEIDREQLASNVYKTVAAGDDIYDLVYGSFALEGKALLANKALINLMTVPHLNFDSKCWSKLLTDALTYNGIIYYNGGYIVPTYLYSPVVVLYNNVKFAEYGFESTPYDDVKNSSWTYDTFYTYVVDSSRDLNGDGIFSGEDFMAFNYTDIAVEGFYIGGGNSLGKINSDGSVSVGIVDYKSSSAIEKLRSIFGNKDITIAGQEISRTGKPITDEEFFGNSNGLFASCSMDTVSINGREMVDDYTIVPCPKYDETQSVYQSSLNAWVNNAIMIPKTVSDLDRTGLIIESLAAYGYENLRPAVYDNMILNKIARNDETIEMLDIIYSNTIVDINTVYNFGGTSHDIRNYIKGKNNNYVSAIASHMEKANAEIADYIESHIE